MILNDLKKQQILIFEKLEPGVVFLSFFHQNVRKP